MLLFSQTFALVHWTPDWVLSLSEWLFLQRSLRMPHSITSPYSSVWKTHFPVLMETNCGLWLIRRTQLAYNTQLAFCRFNTRRLAAKHDDLSAGFTEWTALFIFGLRFQKFELISLSWYNCLNELSSRLLIRQLVRTKSSQWNCLLVQHFEMYCTALHDGIIWGYTQSNACS